MNTNKSTSTPNSARRPRKIKDKPTTNDNDGKENIFLAAADNVLVMHEIENILNNDDIPMCSRIHFLRFIKTSCTTKLTSLQQKNVKVFRDLFIRIDKDTRLCRTVLTLIVDIAVHFKFENSPLVVACRELSIKEHFPKFVEFAKRKNPIIEKDSPLQLILALGISLIQLAIKSKNNEQNEKESELNKRHLMEQYGELSAEMSARFINFDFGEDIVASAATQDPYSDDLNSFNNDFDDSDDTEETDVIIIESSEEEQRPLTKKNVQFTTTAQIHEYNSEVDAEDKQHISNSKPLAIFESIEEEEFGIESDGEDDNEDFEVGAVVEVKTEEDNSSSKGDVTIEDDVEDNIAHVFNNMLLPIENGKVSPVGGSQTDDILKTLKNGDQELDLQVLDSLVTQAGKQFGPAVLNTIKTTSINNKMQSSDIFVNDSSIHFNNHNVKSIVDFVASHN